MSLANSSETAEFFNPKLAHPLCSVDVCFRLLEAKLIGFDPPMHIYAKLTCMCDPNRSQFVEVANCVIIF